jgi:hypothetical protein
MVFPPPNIQKRRGCLTKAKISPDCERLKIDCLSNYSDFKAGNP